MFNRKKKEIERLTNNITKLNENRMELSGENIRLQKEVANLNEKFTCLEAAIREASKKIAKIYDILNPKPTKDVDSKPSKKIIEETITKKEKNDIDKWYQEEFKTILAKTGYNQTTLGKELGISSSTICGLTKKDRNVAYNTKIKVRDFLIKKVEGK